MRNEPEVAESALVSPAWVENKLGISRQTRLHLETQGVLNVVRLTPTSHRRYRRDEVAALAVPQTVDVPPTVDAPKVGEAPPTASPTAPRIEP